MIIHFVGSCGVSMRALMEISKNFGHTVTGSDIKTTGHNPAFVEGADLVVYTSAVGSDNEELLRAKELSVPVMERARFLGEISKNYKKVIAVSGTHGKTTTTGFLQSIFEPLGATVHIGGRVDNKDYVIGGRDIFVTEACEYKNSFLELSPSVGIILNTELDHTDFFRDLDEYKNAFFRFAKNCETVVVPHGYFQEYKAVCGGTKIVTFGVHPDADYRAENKKDGFTVFERGVNAGRVRLRIHGGHNTLNALAAYAAARETGADKEDAKAGLAAFKGVARRFERLANVNGAEVFSDYAHHPREIEPTVASAKPLGKRAVIVFEPHTYSRTKSLEAEFASALAAADKIILLPIYAAREKPIEGVSSHNILLRLLKAGKNAMYFSTYYELINYLNKSTLPGDVIVFTGAGTIDEAAAQFVQQADKSQD